MNQPGTPLHPDRLAVVISTYNKPAYLRLVLEGYRRQTDHTFSIYIADDGSNDDTRRLVEDTRRDFPVPVEHIWHEDRGFRKARVHNLALSRIREPYVLLTDGDCLPLPEMVATHRRAARQGCFVSGSRILLSRAFSEAILDNRASIPSSTLAWTACRLRGDINRLLPLLMPAHLSVPRHALTGIRGCHLACWRNDLLHVNGFDESFEGWGREDSDLAARFFHAGIQRKNLYGMPVLHLWHPEASRDRLDRNDDMLRQCLEEHRVRARKGLAEL